MKEKIGKGFKRHTKLDDALLCLYLDLYLPGPSKWVRVDVELAKTDNIKRQAKQAKKTDLALLSTASDDDE